MANITAHLNIETSWTSAGIADTVTITDIDQTLRNGVQIELAGFDLEDCIIVATTETGATKTVTPVDGTGQIGLIGEGFSITQIVLSNVTAGTRNIRFSQ